MIRIKILLLLLVIPISTFCQNNWQKVGNNGLDLFVKYLYTDTSNNLLYVSGNFEYADNINVNQIAKWNNISWDSLGHGEIAGGAVYGMTYYQNKVYASGNFCNDFNNVLGKWDGISWDSSCNEANGAVYCFNERNGELYMGGNFLNASSVPAKFLAKYDGANWNSFPTSTWSGAGIFALEFYSGELYCGGGFYDFPNGISRISKYDGNNFVPVGTGINGALSSVTSLVVYQNELYIGGGFIASQGNAGNYIVKWDGNTMTSVGGGTDWAINDMEVYGGYLYVVGDFTLAGGIPASKIARWDGTNWTALGPEQFDNNISAIAFYQDQLYAGGGFKIIDGDTVNYIAKYTGPLSVKEENKDFSVNIFPNPTSNEITVQLPKLLNEDAEFNLVDVLGQTVLTKKIEKGKRTYAVNISSVSDGLYFVNILIDNKIYSTKVIKHD